MRKFTKTTLTMKVLGIGKELQEKSHNIKLLFNLNIYLYHWTRELLEPMFKRFGSENLIKDLSAVLKQAIYLPGDFIILKGDIGEEMYFIAEGSVYILAADKRTVLNTLGKGAYFGEMAIFLDSNKRTAYVQADTFCNILILSKQDVDKLKKNYPSVAEDIKAETIRRSIETKVIEENKDKIENSNKEEEKKALLNLYSTPKSNVSTKPNNVL